MRLILLDLEYFTNFSSHFDFFVMKLAVMNRKRDDFIACLLGKIQTSRGIKAAGIKAE